MTERGLQVYRPLDKSRKEIRLLVVKHGQRGDDLCCFFDYAFLTSTKRPQYETVSYVWGDPTTRTQIEVNGTSILVPATSAAVLQYVRLPDRDRVLWIDAVCINQGDIDERGSQVGMMDHIYMGGTSNLAILGGDDLAQGELAASAIRRIRDYAIEEIGNESGLNVLWVGDKNSELGPFLLDIDESSVQAARSMLEAPWFRRLWVVQEVALPSRTVVYFDRALIDLLHIRQTIIFLMLDAYRDRGICTQIVSTSTLANLLEMLYICRCAVDTPIQMDNLLDLASAFDVTDPRDKVYGMLGLFRRARDLHELHPLLVPDYTCDLRVVLRNATRFAIYNVPYMGALWRSQRRMVDQREDNSVLSWVPLLREKYPLSEGPQTFKWSSAAHGTSHATAKLAPHLAGIQDDILIVEGFSLDTLYARTRNAGLPDLDAEYRDYLESAVALSTQAPCTSPTPLQDLETVLIAGEPVAAHGRQPLKTALAFFRGEEGVEIPDVYLLDADGYHDERCFFTTANGRMGIGPDYLVDGDTIAILAGVEWPMALRRCEGEAEQYILLGPCYVHGVMKGEAADEHDSHGLPWRWFDLG